MKALFIGRFQPFHNGHLKIIQQASKGYNEVIIGIGSSQYDNTLENPFTSDERKLMIETSLENEGIRNYSIALFPDIHNYPKWVSHVVSITSDFDIVLSNSSLTKRLFSEKGYVVKKTPIFDRSRYSGKEIRERIVKNKPWKNLVPKSVYKIIKEIDGVNRLKKLSNC